MLQAHEAARDTGVNLAFFGAGDARYQARLDGSLGVPLLVSYRDTPAKDPLAETDPGNSTGPFGRAPLNLTAASLLGVGPGGETPTVASGATRTRVLLNETFTAEAARLFVHGPEAGVEASGIVGYQYDGPRANATAHVLARAASVSQEAVVWRASSGAYVFTAGALAWTTGFEPWKDDNGALSRPSPGLRALSLDVLRLMGGDAGAIHVEAWGT
jgi:hypothetical protein